MVREKWAKETGEFAMNIISRLRKYKSDNGMSMNAEINKVNIYTERDISSVAGDVSGVMKIKKLEVKSGKPKIVEKIVSVTPDFGKIGPTFGKDTNKVALLLKTPEIAKEVEEKGVINIEGFELKKDYIFKIERESVSGDSEERMEIIEDIDFVLEIKK
jgi:valyl-tRNA synthetase